MLGPCVPEQGIFLLVCNAEVVLVFNEEEKRPVKVIWNNCESSGTSGTEYAQIK
jgi:hypothetical protein